MCKIIEGFFFKYNIKFVRTGKYHFDIFHIWDWKTTKIGSQFWIIFVINPMLHQYYILHIPSLFYLSRHSTNPSKQSYCCNTYTTFYSPVHLPLLRTIIKSLSTTITYKLGKRRWSMTTPKLVSLKIYCTNTISYLFLILKYKY